LVHRNRDGDDLAIVSQGNQDGATMGPKSRQLPTIDEQWVDLYVDEERRTNLRYGVRVSLTLSARDAHGREVSEQTESANVSSAGMFFVTGHDLSLSAPVSFTISPPTEPDSFLPAEFSGTGSVARKELVAGGHHGLAVVFDDTFANNMDFALFLKLTSQRQGH
jgi:hypothetical protein